MTLPDKSRPRVLCVDDEPQILEGLSLHLNRRYDVQTATSGPAGLEILAQEDPIAVVISDMRMPVMDGAAFLRRARQVAPDTTRLLLTGQSDFDSAVSAVNEGQILRFLSKPCAPSTLLMAVEAGIRQHQLVTAERVLLEQTLHGSIKTLTDVLALTNPVSFGRATRIKHHVSELATRVQLTERWQLEVAAMLSQLGFIGLPPETAEKVYYGQPLNEAERQMLARAPAIAEQLLGNIPRLEGVREILAACARPRRVGAASHDPRIKVAERAAELLRVAVDFDELEAQGMVAAVAIETMRGRANHYEPALLDALDEACRSAMKRELIKTVSLAALRPGMVLAEDLKMINGTLLATRGYEVTSGFVERARNFRAGSVKDAVRVVARIAS